MRPVAISWSISETSGWGLLGTAIAQHYAACGNPPLLLAPPVLESLRPSVRDSLAAVIADSVPLQHLIAGGAGRIMRLTGDVLVGFGNNFMVSPAIAGLRGDRTIGLIAFETTAFPAAALADARAMDLVVLHSSYNQAVLAAQGILCPVVFQGVDPHSYRPLPRQGRFGDRFVVFSGGKLEFRKGQDLVLAAFRRFHARHPESLLVTAWHSPWPQLAATMTESPWVETTPTMGEDGALDLVGWAGQQGLPAEAFLDLGFLSRDAIPPLMAECDAALFPNRCEGGTNLVAMEAMACGVPTILSANTGHCDIIRDGLSWPLAHQIATPDREGNRAGWGESDIDDMVAALDEIHADRNRAQRMALAASDFIRGERSWSRCAAAFAQVLDRQSDGDATLPPRPEWVR